MLFQSDKTFRLVDVIHGGDSKKVSGCLNVMFSGKLFSRSLHVGTQLIRLLWGFGFVVVS